MRLLALLPNVRAVVTMGAKASEGWSLLLEGHPHVNGRYQVIHSLLTSARGITEGSRHSKEEGVQRVVADLKKAGRHPDPPVGLDLLPPTP
jgi:hypothetical protein